MSWSGIVIPFFKFLLSIQFFMTEKEIFTDGQPKELAGYKKPERREKTFLEKISAIAGLVAVTTAIPTSVQAENDGKPQETVRGAIADTIPMSSPGKSTHNFGFVAAVGVDPVHEGGVRSFPIELLYRYGNVPGKVTDLSGQKRETYGSAHCGFVSPSWTPELITQTVRARVALGGGFCVVNEFLGEYSWGGQPIEIVERETSFAGRGETGIEIGGKNIGFTVGVDAIINDGHLTNFWGPQIGIGGKW